MWLRRAANWSERFYLLKGQCAAKARATAHSSQRYGCIVYTAPALCVYITGPHRKRGRTVLLAAHPGLPHDRGRPTLPNKGLDVRQWSVNPGRNSKQRNQRSLAALGWRGL
ncbi:hypothetical protein AOLI_G00125820 [Acnodon oligacanthus]